MDVTFDTTPQFYFSMGGNQLSLAAELFVNWVQTVKILMSIGGRVGTGTSRNLRNTESRRTFCGCLSQVPQRFHPQELKWVRAWDF